MREDVDLVVWTTDFRPLAGGIAEFMHNLWHHVGRYRPVTVMSTVPIRGENWEHNYRLEHADSLLEGRAGRRPGDTFRPMRKLNTVRYLLTVDRGAKQLVARLRRDFDQPWVYIGVWNLASQAWCRELQRAQVPYTLFAHGTEIVRPLRAPFTRWRRRDFLGANEIIANSTGTAELVTKRFGAGLPVRVIRPGIAAPPADAGAAAEAGALRARLGLSGTVLLTVGRLVPRKGIDLVLRSIADLTSEFPSLTYVIAGDGPDSASLKRLAAELQLGERVRFIGQVDEVTKWSLYRTCDLFVMPNRLLSDTDWEGFGIVFLEAAVAERAVIGGRNGGVPDAVLDGVTGLLVDPENADELTDALRRLLRDPGLRRRMGEAAAARARREFGWAEIVRRFCAERSLGVEAG